MSNEMKATSIAFERLYSDNSGVEYSVRLVRNRDGEAEIEFKHIDTVSFPAEELDWLRAALDRIREEMQP